MKLYILGKTKDDKGTQLEQLTCKILEYQGYVNVATNIQVSGASEIDVTACKTERTGIKEISTPVICECKAHEKPIVMTDWLKFIGKLYIARKAEPRTIGLMLALSGANGAVIGSATNDFKGDAGIQLIANDDIITLLTQVFGLLDIAAVRSKLSTIPIPRISDVNLLYYNFNVWWIAECEDGHFTVFHSDLRPASYKEANTILPMLPDVTIYQEKDFFDVWQDMETGMLIKQIQKLLLSDLLINGPQKKNIIYERYKDYDNQILTEAIDTCEFFVYGDNLCLSLCGFSEANIVDLYRFMLNGECPVSFFATKFYQDNINEDLMEKIWQIQGGFKLPSDMLSDSLQLLKLSPSALRYALHYDRVLSGATLMRGNVEMTNLYNSHFMSMLQYAFINDYRNQALSNLYYETFEIHKLQICTLAKIFHKDGSTININVNQNYALAKLEGPDQAVLIVTK